MAVLLSAVLFLSGAAAVAFQTLWFRQTGLVVGNSVWASSIVLASFMAGLALGNAASAVLGDRLRRPLVAFALLECTIGAMGFAVVVASFSLSGWLAPLLRPFANAPFALNALRLAIAFALLLVPATAMGVTLPLLVRVLFERHPNFGAVLGRLYGWNTLGATLGAVAGDAILIEKLGVVGTAGVAAACNVAAALGGLASARLLARSGAEAVSAEAAPPAASPAAARSPGAVRALLGAAFLAGGIFLALEVVWFRFLLLFIHNDTLGFSLMLAVVLVGIGTGGVAASRWLARDSEAPRFAAALAFVCGAACIATYAGFQFALPQFLTGHILGVSGVLYLAACLMLPSALATGVLFPLLGAAAKRASDAPARATGRFVLANTLGAALGPLMGGFVLLPDLGMERSLFGLAAAYGVIALLAFAAGAGTRPRLPVFATAALFGLGLVLFPFGIMQRTYFTVPVMRHSPDGSEHLIAVREGVAETILYLRAERFGEPYSYRLITNSFSMSATEWTARRYMKLFVYLPVALHPGVRRALLISYGVGSTAKALVDTPGIESIDVVDISRNVLEMSALVHPSPADNPLHDPRVHVHLEDGRFFLQVTKDRFDLITGEPPPPNNAGIAYLYSQEYFELVRNRLNDGGIATYWLPVSLPESDTKAVIAAFCGAFPDCTLWNGSDFDWVLMGSRGGVAAPSEEMFVRQWQDPKVRSELRAVGIEVPEQLGTLFLDDAPGLRARTAGVAPVADNFPLRLSRKVPDQGQIGRYRQWANTNRTREAFMHSEWVAQTWPPALREASLPYFRHQAWINGLMISLGEGPPEMAPRMKEIRELLLETPLETLPLWLLGSDADEARIVERLAHQGHSEPALKLRLALDLLSQRRYAEAAAAFRATSAAGVPSYEALALALAGRDEEARAAIARVADGLRRPEPGEREYWRWLSGAFGLPDPYASMP